MKRTSKQVKTSPANYTPNVIPAKSKAVNADPKVTLKRKYARKSMTNLIGAEMSAKMGARTSVNHEVKARQQRRIKQGL